MELKTVEKIRVDKWLWAVRIFKSRSLAKKAVEDGKVKIEDETLKPSRILKTDEVLAVRVHYQNKIFKVIKLIEKRVGATLASECYEDLTPVEDAEAKFRPSFYTPGKRERGTGRPTKKERRDIDKWKDK